MVRRVKDNPQTTSKDLRGRPAADGSFQGGSPDDFLLCWFSATIPRDELLNIRETTPVELLVILVYIVYIIYIYIYNTKPNNI